ncbi:acyl-CoA synthetase short-chain family member 3, mitochondrial [Lingula anatina]|uniref:Acyl-CoA synthetase short-chain family member 3, mitochondrial n=1 Tax=Lingula anatina TaxID=7574 RepID=A0A1S3IZ40_LINAN|nr:acyl-CoA synthetase short-chain family member 3, mitochondrial [Lingula anatina]|eukprot:XP_013403467.1 acyl-CoA synthetase short-chain family member 3, mitochondrial [Lingula anatina]
MASAVRAARTQLQKLSTCQIYAVQNNSRVISAKVDNRRRYSHYEHVYNNAFMKSKTKPDEFWAEAAENISWMKKFDKVLDNSNPPFSKWFVGGQLNTCYNAIDRHVEQGYGDHVAVIHDSPVTNTQQKITFAQLQDQVSRFAGALTKHGVKKGEVVLIYMPMIPEAIIAMLACARIGAVHSLVFGGFAAKELSTRIAHAEPKVIVSANCGIEPGRVVSYKPILDEAIQLSGFQPNACLIYNRTCSEASGLPLPAADMTSGRDYDFVEELSTSQPHDCVPVDATDPVYLLYTSGTTGLPKAVVRPSGGHAVALHWSMWNIYGMRPREVWWAASDLGWVVGHSYICYAPLLHGNTTVIFEGKPVGTPDAGVFFRVLEEHEVSSMFVAPTALRAIRREDPDAVLSKKYTPKKFRGLFVAGEHCDHETMEWARDILHKPILDNWWQTETGWAITSTCVGLANHLYPPPGVAGKPVPGYDVKVIRDDGSECIDDELGNIVVKLPLPPGTFSTLYKADERFRDVYFKKFPGYYDTMDAGFRDHLGNIAVMARADDVINVAGHRLSTGQLEEVMLELNELAECAVVGVKDSLKGQIPIGLCVLKAGVTKPHDEIIASVVKQVRDHIGPVASFKKAVIVHKLPKTRSGKIARNTIAAMADGKPFKIPVTIEDAGVYPDIKRALQGIGLAPDVVEEQKAMKV